MVSPSPPAGGASRSDIKGELCKNEKTVIALLESASQSILVVNTDGRIVLANRRTEEMFGYDMRELLGSMVEILIPDSVQNLHAKHRSEYFAHPRVRPIGIGIDLTGRRKDGREFPVEISLNFLETEDAVFAIAFVTDISQRKQLEVQLLHSQKMEAIGRLAGGVAHDFNNMLTIIAGYNRMILDGLSLMDPLRGYAEEILKAANRAGALTQQLLTFSRRQLMHPRVIDPNALIATTEKMVRCLIGEDIELQLGLDPSVGNIRVDPGHLEQAILNLAVNSRDAMPMGGRLSMGTAEVQLDGAYGRAHFGVTSGDYVMIAVSDTGHGMDAETKKHIFEPFFTTKAAGKGTGLGLATVYGIVKQSGGDILVYSEPRKGTTFKLYFPKVADAADSVSATAGVKSRGTETILLAEDEDGVRNLAAIMLEQRGYTVLKAANAREAMEISRSYRGEITLLVTDIVMPQVSGKELADELARSNPALKVLYLSGYPENTVVHHGVLDMGTAFLAKPFSQEGLVQRIQEILGKA